MVYSYGILLTTRWRERKNSTSPAATEAPRRVARNDQPGQSCNGRFGVFELGNVEEVESSHIFGVRNGPRNYNIYNPLNFH